MNFNNIIKIVVTTKTLKKYFVKNWGIRENKIQVLHNGSSLKPFFKTNYNHKIKIGYFGSIYKSRGIEMILKLSKLDKQNKYFIYGGTKEEARRIKSNNFGDNLIVHNYIPYKQIHQKLKDIDVCILPYSKKLQSLVMLEIYLIIHLR